MAYQPTFPKPYLNAIDANLVIGNVFSVVLNPKDVISKYNLTILNAETNASVYTTGVVTLSAPLYGSFEQGTTLDIVVPAASGMQNGTNYNWQLTLYDSGGGSVTTPLYYYLARSSPVISFSVDSTVTSCEYEFKAVYSQAQGEKYLYYNFSLYSDGVLIDTSGDKMEAKMAYTYTGLMSGQQYRIDLTVVMGDRTEYKLSRNFHVSYHSQQVPVFPVVKTDGEKGFVDVDYSQSVYIKGNTNKAEQYQTFRNVDTGSQYTTVRLIEDQSVYYNRINETKPISIPDGFTIYLHENFLDLFSGKIIELTDEETGQTYTVRYDSKYFYYRIGNEREVMVDPYVDSSGNHKERSVVHPPGTTLSALQYDTLYILKDADILNADTIFMYNDITRNFWWHITLLPNRVLFQKGAKYDESVVS